MKQQQEWHENSIFRPQLEAISCRVLSPCIILHLRWHFTVNASRDYEMTSRGILSWFFAFAKGVVIGNNCRFQTSGDLIEIGRPFVEPASAAPCALRPAVRLHNQCSLLKLMVFRNSPFAWTTKSVCRRGPAARCLRIHNPSAVVRLSAPIRLSSSLKHRLGQVFLAPPFNAIVEFFSTVGSVQYKMILW